MPRLVKVGFDFLVNDDATQEQIDAVIADAFAQFDDARICDDEGTQAHFPTGSVFVRAFVTKPGFPGEVG